MAKYTREQVAKLIDHAVLKPPFTDADVIKHARMCVERGVGCLCVRPSDVKLAAEQVKDTGCIVAAVIGFPHGCNLPQVKALEARWKSYRRTEMWLYLDKEQRPPPAVAQQMTSAVLRETYLTFAMWTSLVAAAMWVLALVFALLDA